MACLTDDASLCETVGVHDVGVAMLGFLDAGASIKRSSELFISVCHVENRSQDNSSKPANQRRE